MTVKFNQYWRIDPEKVPEYEKYLLTKFIPGVNHLGIHVVAGWVVLVGGYSEILCEGITTDLHLLEQALTHPKYKELNSELLNCTKNYKTKVLVSSGRKEAYSKDIKTSTIKFTQAWDVVSRKSGGYEKFATESFYPCLEELGIKVAGEWVVLVGGYSEILCEGITTDLHLLEQALTHPKYKELNSELLNCTKNYKTKVLVSSGRKEAYSKDIKTSTIKFTQAWDVVSRKSGSYEKFATESFYPCLEELGIKVAGEWEVIIGDGPRIICEGRVEEAHTLIENLQSAKFQKARKEMKQFVENYESRILTFHIQKMEGYKSQSYQFVAG